MSSAVEKKSDTWKWSLLGLLILVLLATFMLSKVWKQEAYNELSRSGSTLDKELIQFKSKVILADLDLNELSKRIRLEKLGEEKFSLVYNTNSFKLRVREEKSLD